MAAMGCVYVGTHFVQAHDLDDPRLQVINLLIADAHPDLLRNAEMRETIMRPVGNTLT